jgi:hypothetical protein
MPLFNNFVDLVSAQSVNGIKTLLANLLFNKSSMVISSATTGQTLQLCGGAGTATSDGASLLLNSDGSGSGSATLFGGSNGGARLVMRLSNASSNFSVQNVSNATLWSVNHAGELVQDGTNGSNLILNKLTASLPLKLDASKNVTAAAIALGGSEVTGTLGVTNGGTGATIPDGWTPTGLAGTYVSASSFTVPADITTHIQVGTKFKLTNSTVKYGHILSASFGGGVTTINIIVNTDYVLTNTTITSFSISHVEEPVSFPARFNWSPTITGFSANPASGIYNYWVTGGM